MQRLAEGLDQANETTKDMEAHLKDITRWLPPSGASASSSAQTAASPSRGAVSNCISAMVRHVREGGLVVAAGGDDLPPEPLPAVSGPAAADRDGSGHPDLPARLNPGSAPLPARLEEASMAPHVERSESRVNVAGSQEMVPALRASSLVVTIIAPDRAGKTIWRLFWMVLDRPPVADIYRARGAFRGDYQTCTIHVWRNGESLAVTHGTDSPEQTYSRMLLDIHYAAKDAAAAVTRMAGGPAYSACRIGLPTTRAVPGLAGLAASARAEMADGISKVIHAYRHMEVSHPDTRTFATIRECPAAPTISRGPSAGTWSVRATPGAYCPTGRPPALRRCCRASAPPAHPGDVIGRCRRGKPRLLGVRIRQAAARLRAYLSGPADARGRTARAVAACAAL